MKNNFKKLEDDVPKIPEKVRVRIKDDIDSRIGLTRFVGEVADLYFGKIGPLITAFFTSFNVKAPEEDTLALGAHIIEKPKSTSDAEKPPTEGKELD